MKLKDWQLREWLKAGKPIAGKSDGGGLTFTLSNSGTAFWLLRYRYAGKPREMTLGNYPDVTLTEARKAATAARAKIDVGVDIAGEKRKALVQTAAAKDFRQLAEEYLARMGAKLAERSRKEVRRYLDKDLLPKLGTSRSGT